VGTASSIVKRTSGWLIVLAVSFIVLGLIAIIEPVIAGLALTIWVGWLLIFGGIVHLIGAFRSGGLGGATWQLLLAAIYLIGGGYFLTHTLLALGTLTLLLAGILVAEAILEIVAFVQSPGEAGRGWRVVNAAITLLLGLMIWRQWPSSSIWAIGTLVGVNLIVTGVTRLMLGMTARRVAQAMSVVLAIGFAGSPTPAEAQMRGVSFIVNISAEPSIGGTAIGAATGTINGSTISVPEASWTVTHSQRSPLFEGGVAVPVTSHVDIVAFVDYGHAGAKGEQVAQLAGAPVTLVLDDYNYWGVEGGAHLRRASGVGPYARVTAGFRRVSRIQANVTTVTLTSSVPVYDASVVPVFAFGAGMLFGDQQFAFGVEAAVRYAGAPAAASSANNPTVPPGGTSLSRASGAGARWSLPIGVVFRF
jgi:uncharacterized membrane protein HdeD (DUF308 family)